MALKSVLEIDVQDEKFVAFQAQFNRYQEAVASLPGAWGKIANGTDMAGAALDALGKKAAGQNSAASARALMQGRANDLQKRADGDALTRMGKLQKGTELLAGSVGRVSLSWKTIAGDSKKIYDSIDGATKSLMKWSLMKGIFAGLTGAGGSLYGIDKLAGTAAAGRRSAAGLGISFGEQRAFSTDYGRFVDADSMLSNVAGAKTDITGAGYQGLLGAGLTGKQIQSGNAADVSIDFLHRLPQMFKGVQPGLIGPNAEARGLTNILSAEDIKRYVTASPAERAQQDKAYTADKTSMNVGDGTLKGWTDLNSALTRASTEIEKAFIQGLAPLAPEIADLSKGVVKLVSDFTKSKEVKEDLDALVTGLGNFEKAINDPDSWWNQGGKALNKFAKKEKEAGDATHSWLKQHAPWATADYWFPSEGNAHLRDRRAHNRATGSADPSVTPDSYSPAGPIPGASGYGSIDAYWKGQLGSAGEGGKLSPSSQFAYLKSIGADDNEALMLTGAAASESSFNPDARHDPDPWGNFTGHGLFGHKDTRLDMRGKDWQQQDQAALAELRSRPEHALLERARTPQEIADAEMHYEQPRGYSGANPRGGDNYTGRMHSIERFAQAFTGKPTDAERGTVTDRAAFEAEQRRAAGQARADDAERLKRYHEQQATPPSHPHSSWTKLADGRTKDDAVTGQLKAIHAETKSGNAMFHDALMGSISAKTKAFDDRMFGPDDMTEAVKKARGTRPGDDQGSSLDTAKGKSSGLGLDKLHRKTGHDISIYNASGANVSTIAGPASYG